MSAGNIVGLLAEQAAQAFLVALIVAGDLALTESTAVYTGTDDDTVTHAARVTCSGGNFERSPEFDSNWDGSISIEIRSNAHDYTRAQHLARAGEIFSAFMTDTITSDLDGALSGFSVHKVWATNQTTAVKDGDCWLTTLTLDLKGCCGSDIS